ncbi:5-formyltetrahydrofolate cyclo-ligase [Idiomarina sp. HP20-50]|uniref:5-formyltetrahydrofolate cyclo-ligase n=1 Tax=Idiomarina sp. HP20-50 TaxID=3070813 RepID=UPI00294B4F9A|nr:5-formyltetrahydrofolate cyclo-ligase [Idiomarina sp. HP20-50]MDV6315705.1 5-formyltetrahydrofolate cyclo-ligase [Idiomarina sp. HP20-50]
MTRHDLRRKLQQIRRNLTPEQQEAAGLQVASILEQRLQGLPPSQTTVAVYKSFAGELPTQPIIEMLWKLGFQVVLPVLHPFTKGHLLFLRYSPDTPLAMNKYDIEEPVLNVQNVVPLDNIQVLLMPLVGFDNRGNRLGMGGGYYDRTLAQWYNGHRPNLSPIGLGYNEQRVEEILVESWDIPLSEIITPEKHWYF